MDERIPFPFKLQLNQITVAVGHVLTGKGTQHPLVGHIVGTGADPTPFTGTITGFQWDARPRGRPKGSIKYRRALAAILAKRYFQYSGMKATSAEEEAAKLLCYSDPSSLRRAIGKAPKWEGRLLFFPGDTSDGEMSAIILVRKGWLSEARSDVISGRGYGWQPGFQEAPLLNFKLTGKFNIQDRIRELTDQ